MMWWGPGEWSWMWGIPMMLGMLVFWGLIVWAVVALVRSLARPRETVSDPETILAERFAAGEIDETEYGSRLEVLRRERGSRQT